MIDLSPVKMLNNFLHLFRIRYFIQITEDDNIIISTIL